ncbi:hypothetical protein ACHWQZ_G014123 [Mnemiopsis leidyi]
MMSTKVIFATLCSVALVKVSVSGPASGVGTCFVGDKTYRVGDKWAQACNAVCRCRAPGTFECVPMCAPAPPPRACLKTYTSIEDPENSCCTIKTCPSEQV